NVALPLLIDGKRIGGYESRIDELLGLVGLGDRKNHKPDQLSGGEQQRVAIARALANGPPLLLADEPTGNLNTEAGALVMETIRQLGADFNATVIVVTHDPQVAEQTERTLKMVDGVIVEK
ncbi:MAG: ATP-binding cassette domain-containing protein, partial [bacterium]|nr:ATP-binding cassette domain-containing protein [bacterium]